MMRRSIVVTLVIVGLLLPNLAAAAGLELIVTLKSARKIGQVKSKYDLQVLEQIGPQPIFLVLSDSTDLSLIDRMMADRLVVDVEENAFVTLESRPQNDSDAVAGLDQSTMSLFQSTMSLFADVPLIPFFGTEVAEQYATQQGLDVVHATDTRDRSIGAGTRIGFIDTGVDPDHPALAPWLEPGVDLLGTGSTSEFGGTDQSTMSLFQDLFRLWKNGVALDQSTMSLFWEALLALGVDQSTMSLFMEEWVALGLDQSTMSLFWEKLATGSLDQSTMSLFWDYLQTLNLDQSTMSLFWEGLEFLYVNQSTMSLFWEQLQLLYVNQSTMSLFASGMFDSLGHGTAVAGLLHVVAPEARLVPIRAFDSRGKSTLFFAVAAVYAAVDQNVDVLNMSFSVGGSSRSMKRALDFAWSHEVAMVASVGNESRIVEDIYPATHSNVIGVGSTDLNDMITSFSNFGHDVAVMAPGDEVVTTFPGGLWATVSGTSFSAPLVTAGVALGVSFGQSGRTAAQTIVNTADWLDFLHGNEYYNMLGHGRINLDNALWNTNSSSNDTSSTSSSSNGTTSTTSDSTTSPTKGKGKKRN